MELTPQQIARLIREQFDFLVEEFHFTATEEIHNSGVEVANVAYDLPTVRIKPGWNSRDGIFIYFTAKVDTFWIRPASSHVYHVDELLKLVAPETLNEVPTCSWPYETEVEFKAWLTFHARIIRERAVSLLKGDLALCEDMLIMWKCNLSKGLPLEHYYEIIREAGNDLCHADRMKMEEAMATRSYLHLSFMLGEWFRTGAMVRTDRLRTALNDFHNQYIL